MDPTKPVFEVGEQVFIYPILSKRYTEPFRGQEACVLSREWSYCREGDGVKCWGWGYVTDKCPVNFKFNGKKHKNGTWSERSLRKKYQAGEDFSVLMKMLNASFPADDLFTDERINKEVPVEENNEVEQGLMADCCSCGKPGRYIFQVEGLLVASCNNKKPCKNISCNY